MWYLKSAERSSKPLLASLSDPCQGVGTHSRMPGIAAKAQKKKRGRKKNQRHVTAVKKEPEIVRKRLLPTKKTSYWDDRAERSVLITGRSQVSLEKLPFCSQLPALRHHASLLALPSIESTANVPAFTKDSRKKKTTKKTASLLFGLRMDTDSNPSGVRRRKKEIQMVFSISPGAQT